MMKTTGSVQEKNGRFYFVINLYDANGKRKIKWISTGLTSGATSARQNLCSGKYCSTMMRPGSCPQGGAELRKSRC